MINSAVLPSNLPTVSFDTTVSEKNDLCWKLLYLKKFGQCTYPPPSPPDYNTRMESNAGQLQEVIQQQTKDDNTDQKREIELHWSLNGESCRKHVTSGLDGPSIQDRQTLDPRPPKNQPTRDCQTQFGKRRITLEKGDETSTKRLPKIPNGSISVQYKRNDDNSNISNVTPRVPIVTDMNGFPLALEIAALRIASWPVLNSGSIIGEHEFTNAARFYCAESDKTPMYSKFVNALMDSYFKYQRELSEMKQSEWDNNFLLNYNAQILKAENEILKKSGSNPLEGLPRSMIMTLDHLKIIRQLVASSNSPHSIFRVAAENNKNRTDPPSNNYNGKENKQTDKDIKPNIIPPRTLASGEYAEEVKPHYCLTNALESLNSGTKNRDRQFFNSSWIAAGSPNKTLLAYLSTGDEETFGISQVSADDLLAKIKVTDVSNKHKKKNSLLPSNEILAEARMTMAPFFAAISPPEALSQYYGAPNRLFSFSATWYDAVRKREDWRLVPFLFFLVKDCSFNYSHIVALIESIVERCSFECHTHVSIGDFEQGLETENSDVDGTLLTLHDTKEKMYRMSCSELREVQVVQWFLSRIHTLKNGNQAYGAEEKDIQKFVKTKSETIKYIEASRELCISSTSRTNYMAGVGCIPLQTSSSVKNKRKNVNSKTDVEKTGGISHSYLKTAALLAAVARGSIGSSSLPKLSNMNTNPASYVISPTCPMLLLEKTIQDLALIFHNTAEEKTLDMLTHALRHFTLKALEPLRSTRQRNPLSEGSSGLHTHSSMIQYDKNEYQTYKRFSEIEYNHMFLLVDWLNTRRHPYWMQNLANASDRTSYDYDDGSVVAAIIMACTLEKRLRRLQAAQQRRRDLNLPLEIGSVSYIWKKNGIDTIWPVISQIPTTAIMSTPIIILVTHAKPYVIQWMRPIIQNLLELFRGYLFDSEYARKEAVKTKEQLKKIEISQNPSYSSKKRISTRSSSSFSLHSIKSVQKKTENLKNWEDCYSDDEALNLERRLCEACRFEMYYTESTNATCITEMVNQIDSLNSDAESITNEDVSGVSLPDLRGKQGKAGPIDIIRDLLLEKEAHNAMCVEIAFERFTQLIKEHAVSFPSIVRKLLTKFTAIVNIHLLSSLVSPSISNKCISSVSEGESTEIVDKLVEAIEGVAEVTGDAYESPIVTDVKSSRISRMIIYDMMIIPILKDPESFGIPLCNQSDPSERTHISDGTTPTLEKEAQHIKNNFFAFGKNLQILVNAPSSARRTAQRNQALNCDPNEKHVSSGETSVSLRSHTFNEDVIQAKMNSIFASEISKCYVGIPRTQAIPPFISGIYNVSTGCFVHYLKPVESIDMFLSSKAKKKFNLHLSPVSPTEDKDAQEGTKRNTVYELQRRHVKEKNQSAVGVTENLHVSQVAMTPLAALKQSMVSQHRGTCIPQFDLLSKALKNLNESVGLAGDSSALIGRLRSYYYIKKQIYHTKSKNYNHSTDLPFFFDPIYRNLFLPSLVECSESDMCLDSFAYFCSTDHPVTGGTVPKSSKIPSEPPVCSDKWSLCGRNRMSPTEKVQNAVYSIFFVVNGDHLALLRSNNNREEEGIIGVSNQPNEATRSICNFYRGQMNTTSLLEAAEVLARANTRVTNISSSIKRPQDDKRDVSISYDRQRTKPQVNSMEVLKSKKDWDSEKKDGTSEKKDGKSLVQKIVELCVSQQTYQLHRTESASTYLQKLQYVLSCPFNMGIALDNVKVNCNTLYEVLFPSLTQQRRNVIKTQILNYLPPIPHLASLLRSLRDQTSHSQCRYFSNGTHSEVKIAAKLRQSDFIVDGQKKEDAANNTLPSSYLKVKKQLYLSTCDKQFNQKVQDGVSEDFIEEGITHYTERFPIDQQKDVQSSPKALGGSQTCVDTWWAHMIVAQCGKVLQLVEECSVNDSCEEKWKTSCRVQMDKVARLNTALNIHKSVTFSKETKPIVSDLTPKELEEKMNIATDLVLNSDAIKKAAISQLNKNNRSPIVASLKGLTISYTETLEE